MGFSLQCMRCLTDRSSIYCILAGGNKEDEGVKYVSLDLSSIEAPLAELPGLRILEVTEVQDLSSGVRVPDLERFMTVLHPSASGPESGYGPTGMNIELN